MGGWERGGVIYSYIVHCHRNELNPRMNKGDTKLKMAAIPSQVRELVELDAVS